MLATHAGQHDIVLKTLPWLLIAKIWKTEIALQLVAWVMSRLTVLTILSLTRHITQLGD